MKSKRLEAIFVLLVAMVFLMPPAAALGTTSGEVEKALPEAETTGLVKVGEVLDEGISDESQEDNQEIPDPYNELDEISQRVPYGQQITHPDKPVESHGPDDTVKTKSSVMVISKIGLHDSNGDPVNELDDGEEGKVSAEITNEGGEDDIMTDVEVDFYYIDKDGDTYFIDEAIIDVIEGGGNSSTAMVNWTADMLAKKIKVIADPDGSDGGPSEAIEDINVTQAEYAQKLYCPYPTGSGSAGDSLEFYIKVDNIGTESDDVKLEVEGAGTWSVKFDNGQDTKTIYGLDSEEHSWEKVTVTIPSTAGGDDYKDIIIKSISQNNNDKVKEITLRTTVLRSSTPILLLDKDHGSSESGTWCDTTRYWAAALDDAGYSGMYYRTSSTPANLNSYDVILMATGYDWIYGLSSSDETAFQNYLHDGGSLWIGGSMFMQASDEPIYGKVSNHPLFYHWMNATWVAENRRTPRPLMGVAGDPIGSGGFYDTNYIYTVAQDWVEGVWSYDNDTWTHGIFHLGDKYIGIRHHWQGTNDPTKPNEYRTVYTGFDLAQVGDKFGKNERDTYGNPDRTEVLYNTVTWLGVAPPLPKANDLGVYKIVDPAGEYVYPGDTIDINVDIANYGIKDYEGTFTVQVDIEQTNGGYSTTLSTTVDASDDPIPARGWAYPGTTRVSLSWNVPNEEDARYKITAKVGNDDNNNNNENFTYTTAKKVEDIKAESVSWEWRLHYWITAVKFTPVGIDFTVKNIGSKSETFTAWVHIVDPWESGTLEEFEREVTLGPGHTKVVHFVWTPDKAAGCRDATQSWRVHYTDDGPPYWLDVGVDITDDNVDNNEITHENTGGYGTNVGDITVVDWYESGEQGEHGWDMQEPWHPSPVWVFGGEYGIWHGNETSAEVEGNPHYDNGVKAIMTSPVLDWTQYSAIRSDYLYSVRLERNHDYVSLQIKKTDEADTWQDAPANYYSNYSVDRGNGGYLNNGNNWNAYAGHTVQIRWCFYSDDATYLRGMNWDLFMIMANADNYFDKDLTISDVSVDPLVDDKEQERTIRVTVQNIGEVVPDSGFRVWCNVTDEQGNAQDVYLNGNNQNYKDVAADANFKKGETKVIEWKWYPEEYGVYNIHASVEWDQDGFPDNNEMDQVGLVQYYFFFDDMDHGNPPPKPDGGYYDEWTHGTEDTNGRGGDRATDDWEEGVPTVGPSSAYSGTKCWGTGLDRYYSNNSKDSSYLMIHIDLRTARDPYLIFASWLEIEAQGYDSAYVEIQEVGETGWHELWKNPEPPYQHYASDGWEMINISLEDYQLKDVNLRFRLMSDSDVSYPGWYIDDVGVSGITPPDYDARVENIEITPFYGGNIPPGESIVIDATISNIGTRDSGGSHRITVSGKVYKVVGSSENKIADLTAQEVQINSGERATVSFNYQLPGGTAKYRIEIEVDYPGELPENQGDNVDSIILWGKELKDVGISRLYATPPLADAGYPRVVTAEITSYSNIPVDFSVRFSVRYSGETQILDSAEVPVSLLVGETKEVSWNWTSYVYADYDVTAETILAGDTNNNEGHENTKTIEVRTVEKIFTDPVDTPAIYNEEYYESFWSGIESNPSTAGWHKVNVGYLSRESYYVGRTTANGRSYAPNMNAMLISDPIDLSEVNDATLRWYSKFHVEGGAYDNLIVYFSKDNGTTWVEQTRYPGNNYRNSSQYSTNDNGWLMFEKMLDSQYFVPHFRIKFRFVSDRGIEFEGVYIDDISIYVTSSGDHKPFARFTAEWLSVSTSWSEGSPVQPDDIVDTAYSIRLINQPLPAFEEIRGVMDYNNLPNPNSGVQGGIGFKNYQINGATRRMSDWVRFDASYSYDPDLTDTTMDYIWNFGDGTQGNGVVVYHRYEEIPPEKYFVVTLQVKDQDDGTLYTEDTIKVWVGNNPPSVRFNITDSFNTDHVINTDNMAELYYGDSITLIPDVSDPEGDPIVSYVWTFSVNESGNDLTKTATGDVQTFTVGVDNLYSIVDAGQPVMPDYNTQPVHYTITLQATDINGNTGSYTMDVVVNPYAMHTFTKMVQMGTAMLEAKVTLVWRGNVDEVAQGSYDVSPERPVFVYIDEASSPDPNLFKRGGIGKVYDIHAVGCYKQNGDEGFVSAEISLPVLTSDLDEIGDSLSLQSDLMLEYYNEQEKRFVAVEGSQLQSLSGVKYVVGTVEHFSVYATIVDSIYNSANSNYESVLPDLSVYKIEFSRQPAQNGQEVEIRAYIKNTGLINAVNVDVKIYDGDDLIGDQVIDVVRAGGEPVVVRSIFTATLTDPTQTLEKHNIQVFVNKQRSIRETSNGYANNELSEDLDVTASVPTTPSFESSSMMMVVTVGMVALGSMALAVRQTTHRRKRE